MNRLDDIPFSAVLASKIVKGGTTPKGLVTIKVTPDPEWLKYLAEAAPLIRSWWDTGAGWGWKSDSPAVRPVYSLFGKQGYGSTNATVRAQTALAELERFKGILPMGNNVSPVAFMDAALVRSSATPDEAEELRNLDIGTREVILGSFGSVTDTPQRGLNNTLFVDSNLYTGRIRDDTPWKAWRFRVWNAARAFEALAEYPWPGVDWAFLQAFLEFQGPQLIVIISAPALLAKDDVKSFITLAFLSKFDEIVDRVQAILKAEIRHQARLATLKGIFFTIIGAVVSILTAGAATGSMASIGAKLLATGIAAMTAGEKKKLQGSLTNIAKEFAIDAPTFAAEVTRTAAWIEAQAPTPPDEAAPAPSQEPQVYTPESQPGSVQAPPPSQQPPPGQSWAPGMNKGDGTAVPPAKKYQLIVEGAVAYTSTSLDEITAVVRDKVQIGQRFEIRYDGTGGAAQGWTSLGLKIKVSDGNDYLTIHPEDVDAVMRMSPAAVQDLMNKASTTLKQEAKTGSGWMIAPLAIAAYLFFK